MAVDAPANGSSVGSSFTVAGWAVDLGASSGSGVDAVHVYATAVGGDSPMPLGVATTGGSRPDVGTALGAQFGNSGFSLGASGLAPGQYDVTVYARSTVTGTFNQARTVRVTVE
jgi:hypothetical protein